MKRVIKIVLLLSFLIAVFIFSAPWLYYWSSPVVDPFEQDETRFYAYDVREGTKRLLASKKGLASQLTDLTVLPTGYDDKRERIFFIKPLHLDYIIPQLGINEKRDSAVLASLDIKTGKVNKIRVFNETDNPFFVLSNFVSDKGFFIFHFRKGMGTIFLMDENRREQVLYHITENLDINQGYNIMVLPVGENNFLATWLYSSQPGDTKTVIAQIRDGKTKVERQKGIGGLIMGYDFLDGGNKIAFTVKDCDKFPITGCKLHFYVYDVQKQVLRKERIISLPDNKILWFAGIKGKNEIFLANWIKGETKFLSYNLMTKTYKPHWFIPYGFGTHQEYGRGKGFVALTVKNKLPAPVERNSTIYSGSEDLYLVNIREKKIISLEKNILDGISSIAWNDAGDKMLYVVRN